jgi:hypothetical protein
MQDELHLPLISIVRLEITSAKLHTAAQQVGESTTALCALFVLYAAALSDQGAFSLLSTNHNHCIQIPALRLLDFTLQGHAPP